MNDWIGLAVIGFIVLCGLFALWQLSKPYEVSVEEFEKRAAEAPSLLSAGFIGLQKILDPATAKQDAQMLKGVVRLNANNAGVYGTVVQTGTIRVGQTVSLV